MACQWRSGSAVQWCSGAVLGIILFASIVVAMAFVVAVLAVMAFVAVFLLQPEGNEQK